MRTLHKTMATIFANIAAMLLGIEIGGTKLQLVTANTPGVIARRWRGTVRKELGGPGICDQIRQAVSELKRDSGNCEFEAIGVGFGGPIDTRTGKVCKSHQIEGWENFPLRDWVKDLVGAPVAVDNDANAAALGEAAHGAGMGFDPVFFTTLGSGVGGGIASQGRIYHGYPPGEAEFGHLRLDRTGATVESRCSGWAVDARIRRLRDEEPDSLLARSIGSGTGGEARHLAAAIAAGDAAAKRILREWAGDLAFGLSHVTHLFHPQAIVLGGGLSLIGEPLRAAVASALPEFVMHAFLPAPKICVPGLGEDSVPIGALELAARL
jgi:glucokinase